MSYLPNNEVQLLRMQAALLGATDAEISAAQNEIELLKLVVLYTSSGGGGGTGDVVGPASATDGHVAVFNGATGKLIKDGGALPSGTVTSVTGTANEISVATGTTTPVLSLPAALTFTGKTVTGGVLDALNSLSVADLTTPAHSVNLTFNSTVALTSNQILTVDMKNASRVLTFNGNLTIGASGGTLNLGGFTLTVPADGTVALIGRANNFTVAQTITEAVGSSALTLTGAVQTANFPVLNATQTWNNAAVAFTGFKLSITNTASSSNSRLFTFDRGGTTMLSMDRVGYIFSDGYYRFCTSDGSQSSCFLNMGLNVIGAGSISGITIGSACGIGFSSSTQANANNADVFLTRDASGILALKNSTTAQTFRVYGTYTDASNYVRLGLNTTSTTLTIAAETAGTGADDIDLAFTPAGTGVMKFGTHSAWVAEVISGYITIKDSGGTSRKLAVIS